MTAPARAGACYTYGVPEQDANAHDTATKPVKNAGASSSKKSGEDAPRSIGGVVQLVKDYASQETIGPLRGAGRWLAFGAAGAVFLGLASVFFVLGVLRLVQTEFAPTFRGQWMQILPYVIAFVVSAAVIGLAVSRIGKKTLQKETS